MKTFLASLAILSFLLIAASAPQEKSLLIPKMYLDPEKPAVSFQDDVLPIFQTKCNQGECHGRQGKAFPKYTTYAMIKAKMKKVVYRLEHKEKPMPPLDTVEKLTAVERKKILDWIDAGMPNN